MDRTKPHTKVKSVDLSIMHDYIWQVDRHLSQMTPLDVLVLTVFWVFISINFWHVLQFISVYAIWNGRLNLFCQNMRTGHVNIDIFKIKNSCKCLNNPILLVIIQTLLKKGKIVLLPLEKRLIMEAAIFYFKIPNPMDKLISNINQIVPGEKHIFINQTECISKTDITIPLINCT